MAHPRIARLALGALLLGACEQGPVRHWETLPGAEPLPEAAQTALDEAWQHRDPAGKPRTRHLREDGTPKYTNRLFLESSPYLRQHAHNPVNWYPWGDEAFETARRLGRPVLLSVGYSTCHWCHVMEEESFEDEEIARFLNEHYVAVKVDREQRPDVDSIYMTAVQAISGRGGWPMTVWLTPDREPFYAGTYFPPRDGDRHGRTGFRTLLETVADSYREDSARLEARASDLAAKIRSILESPSRAGKSPAVLPGADVLWSALEAARRRFDPVHGGPRGAPKFPSTLPVRALLRHHRRSGNEEALHMAVRSLEGMAAGGIHDHLAGGFHRYSVDAEWRVPHFEKMLYDNALLTIAYVEAWQVTGRQDLADVARGILAWTEREMTAPDGGFYSATDADSADPQGEMVEGWYFTWTPRETEALLGADAAALFNMAYGVEAPGNLDGRSVLHAAASVDEVSEAFNLGRDQVRRSLATSAQTLRKAREQRPRPLRDDKILTAWNGLMISAAARASLALDDDRYRAMAARAADFLLRDFASSGRLARSTLGDRRQSEAFLDDYAALAAGLLDLYEAGDGDRRLEQAMALDAVLAEHFEDPAGGFFLTTDDHDDLLVREKPLSDGSEPSGNSLAILNLLRLAEITTDKSYLRRADRALAALSDLLRRHPLGASEALLAVDFADDAAKEIVLVTATDRASLRPLLAVLGPAFVPNRVLLTATDDSRRTRALPLLEGKVAIDGRPTAYVCENNVCDLPTSDPEVLTRQIRRVEKIAPAP